LQSIRADFKFPLPPSLSEVGCLSADKEISSALAKAPMSAFQDPDIYRTILDALQIGVSVLDLEKKIVFWSDGAEQITGYTRMDVLGHCCSDNILLHCTQTKCEMCNEKCPLATALHDARSMEAMTFIHHKSGYRIQVHLWAIPLRDKHGSIIGIIQTFEGEFDAQSTNSNERRMKERGLLDEVTGLPNQAIMQSRLRETLGTFNELHIPFGIAWLTAEDINQFRARYGQGAARSVIQVLGRTLRNTVWPSDLVGTWTDDQFLVILMGCNEEALQAVRERMLRMLAGATIKWWGEELLIAVSIGCAGAHPGDTVESILQRAQQGFGGNRAKLPANAAQAGPALTSKGITR
jgi:diguanylate cyclase (GGDEF)-like protein/PAS domain S-box-containing protein